MTFDAVAWLADQGDAREMLLETPVNIDSGGRSPCETSPYGRHPILTLRAMLVPSTLGRMAIAESEIPPAPARQIFSTEGHHLREGR